MKELKNYILESVEILPDRLGDNYRTIVLTKRTDIDCASLSKEEFISMMTEDYEKAVKEATALLDKEHEENKKARVERVKKEAEAYANSHYKRDSNKKKYIDNAVANELSKDRGHWYDITWFDFDTSFGKDNAINSYCIIKKETLKFLGKVYDDLTDEKGYANTFWKEATGWAFKYTASKDNYHSCFRPWIDLIISDNKREEIKQNEKHLADAINKFYSGTNYWGD